MALYAVQNDARIRRSDDVEAAEREALLRFLDWAEGVARDLGEDDAGED